MSHNLHPLSAAPVADEPGRLPFPEELVQPATPPPDNDGGARLRALARATWLGARAAVLLTRGLFRGRNVTLPATTLVHRLLVLRTDRMGDMALTTAAITDLKAHFRHARLTVLAPPGPLALLESHPAVDRLVPLPGRELPDGMRGHFDLVVDFTSDEALLGARLAAATGAPWRIGLAAAGRQTLFTLPGPRARHDRHLVMLNRDLLAALGVTRAVSLPSLHVTPEERREALARYAALGAAAPRVLVHPGAFHPSQRWAPERFAAVIIRLTERIGAACLVIAGRGEDALVEQIVAATPDALALAALAGPAQKAAPLTVRRMMGLIATADLFLGNNSGPLHVASALGVPTLSLMGPTDPARFMPCGPHDTVVRRTLACSPCGRGSCWHHTCLLTIEPEEVAARAQAILSAPPARRQAA